ncbi:MAG: hypothetical protein ACQER6_04780 [Pseudomonadota bacterium]
MKGFARMTIAAGLALSLGQLPAHAQPPEHAGKPPQAERGGPSMGMASPPERQHGDEPPQRRYGDEARERQYEDERHPRGRDYRFTDRDREHIQDWYDRNLPPGLAKQGKIPPGHAKRLARGESWPPQGMDYEPLPRELVRQLGPLPDHLDYYRVGTDVVIADMAGEVVRDVVYDVLNR